MSEELASIGAGHPGRVVQIAYLVPAIDEAVRLWLARTGAGPFFRARYELATQPFHGRPSQGAIEAAIGYRDDICIELIEYQGDGPCVFADIEPGRTTGLHHIMIASDDLAADLARHRSNDEKVIVDWPVEGFGRTVFVDTRRTLGHFTEYGVWTKPVLNAVEQVHQAHIGWDKSDPVRPYPAILP